MNRLKNKVRVISAGEVADMERSAQDIPAELNDLFVTYVEDALRQMERLLESPGFEDQQWRVALFRLSHNLKGLGGSFGYPLMTDVAASMCAIIRHPDIERDASLHRRVTAHAKALRAVMEFRMSGPGTAEAAALLAALDGPCPH